jgi:hypothetical protein
MKAYEGVDVAALSRGKEPPSTHWIGGWVDHTADLDDVEKIKFLALLRLKLRLSAIQPIASRYTDYTILL